MHPIAGALLVPSPLAAVICPAPEISMFHLAPMPYPASPAEHQFKVRMSLAAPVNPCTQFIRAFQEARKVPKRSSGRSRVGGHRVAQGLKGGAVDLEVEVDGCAALDMI